MGYLFYIRGNRPHQASAAMRSTKSTTNAPLEIVHREGSGDTAPLLASFAAV